MKTSVTIVPALAAMLLCGCQMVYRPRFDISPDLVRPSVRQVGDGPYAVVEIRRFSLPEFACNMISRQNYPCMEVVPGTEIMPELSRLFPALFSDSPDAVPIIVMQNVRSGAVADPGVGSFFGGASGFNKRLSRKNRSDMATTVGFMPYSYFNSLASIGTLGLVPFYQGKFSSHYGVSVMVGYDSYGPEISYSTEARLWIVNGIYRPFTPESSGWIHADVFMSAMPDPDAPEAAKRTALCCAIAKALAEMSPEDRSELRRNPVALLRDKENGSSRTFKLVQVRPERDVAVEGVGAEPNRPRIVSQSYDPATRKGTVVFDASECDDPKAAVAWVRDSYVPLVAAQKARVIDASETAGGASPPPKVSITGFRKETDARVRFDFTVPE